MKEVRCPHCNRLLFKGYVADVETVCGKCGKLVEVKMTTQSREILKFNSENSIINHERRKATDNS